VTPNRGNNVAARDAENRPASAAARVGDTVTGKRVSAEQIKSQPKCDGV
jgi:hypothetical protein